MQSRDFYPGKLLFDRFLDVGCKKEAHATEFSAHGEAAEAAVHGARVQKDADLGWAQVEMAPNRATGTQQQEVSVNESGCPSGSAS